MVSASEVLEEDKAGETLWQAIMICLQIDRIKCPITGLFKHGASEESSYFVASIKEI